MYVSKPVRCCSSACVILRTCVHRHFCACTPVCPSLSVRLSVCSYLYYVCVCVKVYVCMHGWMYVLYMSFCASACLSVCIYVRMYTCMHGCMHACMYVCMMLYVCVYVCMCMHVRICTNFAGTHAHMDQCHLCPNSTCAQTPPESSILFQSTGRDGRGNRRMPLLTTLH